MVLLSLRDEKESCGSEDSRIMSALNCVTSKRDSQDLKPVSSSFKSHVFFPPTIYLFWTFRTP